MKAYACKRCGGSIADKRVQNALTRSRVPSYCSDACRSAFNAAQSKARHKGGE